MQALPSSLPQNHSCPVLPLSVLHMWAQITPLLTLFFALENGLLPSSGVGTEEHKRSPLLLLLLLFLPRLCTISARCTAYI